MKNNIINIENRAGKIKLNDSVHKDSADKLIEELETLYGNDAVEAKMQIGEVVCCADNALASVEVEINTNGGSVMEGQRIYNSLRGASSRGVEVSTVVNGMAASMGSVILMAGDKRSMTHGSRVMIHEAKIGMGGACAAQELYSAYETTNSISEEIAGIYAERTGGNADEFRGLMLKETYMDAAKAKELGFVHAIIKNGKEQDAENKSKSNQTQNTMFNKDKDLAAKLEASQAEVTEHEATIAKREAEAVTLSEDLNASNVLAGEYEASIEDLTAKLEASESTATAATAELAEKVAELEAKDAEIVTAKEVTEEAVSAKAAEIVQMAAHKPIKDDGSDLNAESDEQLLTRYDTISDKDDRREFFAANKTKILRAKARQTTQTN